MYVNAGNFQYTLIKIVTMLFWNHMHDLVYTFVIIDHR